MVGMAPMKPVTKGVIDQVDKMIADNNVMMFSKSYCPFCTKAKDILNAKGIKFHVEELDQIPIGQDIQDTLKMMTGQNTVPNIYVKGKHLGGCSDLEAKQDQIKEMAA